MIRQTKQTLRRSEIQTDAINNPFDFMNGQTSPSNYIKNQSNTYVELNNTKGLTQNSSLTKLHSTLPQYYNDEKFTLDIGSKTQNPQFSQHLKSPTSLNQIQRQRQKPVSSLPVSKDSLIQKSIEINLLKIQNSSLKVQNSKINESLKKLRTELEQKAQMLKKFNQLMKVKYNELKQVKENSQKKQKRILQLQNEKSQFLTLEQTERLKKQLFNKNKELDELNFKINNLEHENFRNEVYQMKISKLYNELEEEKNKNSENMILNSKYTQTIKVLEEKVILLEYQQHKQQVFVKLDQFQNISKLFKNLESSPTKSNKQMSHLTAFDQALKVQMKQIEELKQVIQASQEMDQKLRDNLLTSRRQLQQLRNQMRILQLKANSERKKLIMQYRLQIHEKDNELNSAFKRYKTLEEKYKNALIDIKAKDQFFQQHLVGRANEGSVQQYIEQTLKKYIENFSDIISLKVENEKLLQKLEKYRIYQIEIQQIKVMDQ